MYDDKHSMDKNDTKHHYKQIPIVPKTFLSHVEGAMDMLEELLNPFFDKITDIYELDTNVITPDTVTHIIIIQKTLV